LNTFENKWNYPKIVFNHLILFSMIKVKNANGSSRFRIPLGYDSWLDYWEKQTGVKMSICGCKNCNNTDLVGGHVIKANSTDKHYYITPICRSCNNRTDEFYVYWDLVPVPSNL
jgi:putative tonB-related protein